MSVINKLRVAAVRAILGTTQKGFSLSDPGEIFGQSQGGILPTREPSQDRLMKLGTNWVYKAIKKNALMHSSATLRLYRTTGKEKKDWQEIEDHPLLDVLNSPSPRVTRFELFELWSMQDDLCGNVYWLLDGMTSETSEPTGIKCLNPGRMKPIVKNNELIRYEYRDEQNAYVTKYEIYQILHFRNPAPAGGFLGKGPAGAAIDSIDGDNWAREWMRRFFEQGASPGMLFESGSNEDSVIKGLRESFEERFMGANKAHKIGVLPNGVKVAYEGKGGRDMEFAELRHQMRDEIVSAFGVPITLLGLGAGENLNRATAEAVKAAYIESTVFPRLTRFAIFLNELLVPLFGEDLVLAFDNPAPADMDSKMAGAESALARQPWKTINEVRAEEGMAPIENGDNVMGSSLLVPVGRPIESANPSKNVKKSIVPYKTRFAKNAERRREQGEILASKIFEHVKQYKKDSTKELPEDWTPIWEAIVKRVVPHENDMLKAMQKYAAGMTERAINGLEDATKRAKRLRGSVVKGDLEDFVNTPLMADDEVALIIKLLGPIYQDILEQEGVKAADLVGAAFDANDKRVREALDKAINLMAKSYTDETLTLLRDKLQEGIDNGDPLPDLKKRVQEVGDFSEAVRAKRVANTEAFRTANFAAKEAWVQSGVVKSIKWYTATDEKVCEFCGPLEGTVVGIDENFFELGDSVEGRDGGVLPINYAPVEAGALHPNCRCVTRPEDISSADE